MFWSPPWAVFLLCFAWLKIRKWICLLPNGKLTKLVSSDCNKNSEQGKNKRRWVRIISILTKRLHEWYRKSFLKKKLKIQMKALWMGGSWTDSHQWCHGLSVNEWPLGLLPGQSLGRGSISPLNHNLGSLCAAACFWSEFQPCTRSGINKLLPVHVCSLEKKKPHWLLGSLIFHNITKGLERWTAKANPPWKPISPPVGNAKITGNCD